MKNYKIIISIIILYIIIDVFFFIVRICKNITEKLIVYGDPSSQIRLIETYIQTKFLNNLNKYETMNILTFKLLWRYINPKTYIIFINCNVGINREFTKSIITQFPNTNCMYNLQYFYKDDYCNESKYKLKMINKSSSQININNFFRNYKNNKIIRKEKNQSESRGIRVYQLQNKSQITNLGEFEFIIPYIEKSYVIECGVILNIHGNIIFPNTMYFWKNHYKTIEKQHKRFYKIMEKIEDKKIITSIQEDIRKLIKKFKFKFGYFRFEYIYDILTKNVYIIDFSNSPTSCKGSMLYTCLDINSFDEVIKLIFAPLEI